MRYRIRCPALQAIGLPVEFELELHPAIPAPKKGHSYTIKRAEAYRPSLETMVALGFSNKAVADTWNAEGRKGPRGGRWYSASVKALRHRLDV